ncbi:MAG TPA: FAD-dependent oxidoreductase, partial [Solirubrobacteraceae bacterium]|nr:FAD-dependent oxidoreductase [Solirubrobacteraceae bacterium]
DAAFVEARAGLRPVSADGLPLLGPARDAEGLVLATGHGREGIIHAPPTATLIADGVLGGVWDHLPPALRTSRSASAS